MTLQDHMKLIELDKYKIMKNYPAFCSSHVYIYTLQNMTYRMQFIISHLFTYKLLHDDMILKKSIRKFTS